MKPLLLLAMASLAGSALLAEPQGSDVKGKYYYRKECKTCHVEKGSAPVLTPLSKTQAQWRKFFEAGKHGASGAPIAPKFCKPDHLTDIKAFLVNHASDSPQPMTCGN